MRKKDRSKEESKTEFKRKLLSSSQFTFLFALYFLALSLTWVESTWVHTSRYKNNHAFFSFFFGGGLWGQPSCHLSRLPENVDKNPTCAKHLHILAILGSYLGGRKKVYVMLMCPTESFWRLWSQVLPLEMRFFFVWRDSGVSLKGRISCVREQRCWP